MRKGLNPARVLKDIKSKIDELNNKILPSDIKLVPFYDRDDLIRFCTRTISHNILEGIILVTVIVFLFTADIRATIIVAIIIPLSLLFSFMCLYIKGMSANLISMGAIDFGIIIDGAIVMVESMFVALDLKAKEIGMPAFNQLPKMGLIVSKGTEMGKSIFFSKLIIIMALIPIFSFEKIEGKLFSPLAYTLGFALLGALIFTLTLVPVLVRQLFNKNVRERNNPFVKAVHRGAMTGFNFCYNHKKYSLLMAVVVLAASIYSFKFLGTEFLPPLNEGALWVEAHMPMSMSLTETVRIEHQVREILLGFPEVRGVLSQTGRSNDGPIHRGFTLIKRM